MRRRREGRGEGGERRRRRGGGDRGCEEREGRREGVPQEVIPNQVRLAIQLVYSYLLY